MRRPALDRFAVNLETWWNELPPLDRVGAAVEAGFTQAEIWFWRSWDVARLEAACRRAGLGIAQIGGWDFEPRLSEPANLDGFRRGIGSAVEVAARLGAERINLNGPYLRPGEAADLVRRQVATAIAGVIDLVEDAGLTLMVEPMNPRVDHPGYSLPTSADVLAVCEEVASPALGVNWDLYHLQISEGDLSGHLADGIEHVAYVQVADHPGRHEPGTGEIDYPFLLNHLSSLGYDGPIGLECFPASDPEAARDRVEGLGASLS